VAVLVGDAARRGSPQLGVSDFLGSGNQRAIGDEPVEQVGCEGFGASVVDLRHVRHSRSGVAPVIR
jgi:hypothetical protein